MSATSRRHGEAYSRSESSGGGGRRGGNDRGPRDDRESRRQHNSHGPANENPRITSRDRDRERDSSRVKESETYRERERERGREKERDWGRDKERYGHGDWENHRSRSTKDERVKGKLDEDENSHGHDNDRTTDHCHERDRRHKERSRSRSKDRYSTRHKSRSPSSRSKRTSGFDMAPTGAAVLPDTTIGGQLLGLAQPFAGILPTTLPFVTPQFGSLALMPAQAMTQQATRHARRVYVGGLPPAVNEQTIATFFSHVMSVIGGNTGGPGDAVVNVYINHEKKFAFVEMRSVEEASNAMALDGITFEGVSVRVRRPTDYNPSLAATLGPSQPHPFLNLAAVGLSPGAIGGSEGPDRIFVGGLPYYFTDGQIRELLESFGPLRGFNLVKDRETGNSKGYGFCVYQDPSVTDIACAALNGLKMGDKTLTVRRASASMDQTKPEQEFLLQQAQQHIAMQAASSLTLPGVPLVSDTFEAFATKVVCLTEVVSVDELKDDEEYKEILEDMREESAKFGPLVNIVIPRPSPSGEVTPGVGKVFLEFADTTGSSRAKTGLHGRKFGENVVSAAFYPEDKFLTGDYGAILIA